jgi:hypothetical protein
MAHVCPVLAASGPIPFRPLTLWVPRAAVEPSDGLAFELLGLIGS